MTWQAQAYKYLLEGNYPAVARYYEQVIKTEADVVSHYWHLGLAYLLQEQEAEAQSTWFLVLAQSSAESLSAWTTDLIKILEAEAQRQESLENRSLSWLIRGHIRELDPNIINNLLHLIQLDISLQHFHSTKLEDWNIPELLQRSQQDSFDSGLLMKVLQQVIEFPGKETLAFIEASWNYIPDSKNLIQLISAKASKLAHQHQQHLFAAQLVKLCLKQQPDNLFLLKQQFWYCALGSDFDQALEVAHQFYDKCHSLPFKVSGNYQLLYVHILRSNWLEIDSIAQRHEALLLEMVQEQTRLTKTFISDSLALVTHPLLYIQDRPEKIRWMINRVSQLFQEYWQSKQELKVQSFPACTKDKNKPLKIGYIAHTLRAHSVGWLSRWLFHYRNREVFKVAIYLINQQEDSITQQWFRPNADVIYNFSGNAKEIVNQIQDDEVDILVDLDSLTYGITCQVMALKPAPVQVTWLGMDASGIPAIDYFIADPYVLPEDSQTYYKEKIWRLPHSYVAVDGFEVGIPTIRREHFDIPADAVVYLNLQNAPKRHPDTIRLQMQIIKAVPNSYLFIKGTGNEQVMKQFFTQLAEEEGVDPARLRFLPIVSNELIHRANLQIADVVLDTYPYNGATTTLEVLWMGIPLVTRVGQQFAARNSYTFMTNAGITEGIAWSAEEYVQWGIRLGKNKALREQIALKLRASRQTSPLWNAEQFTREMEKAYREMWTKYCMEGSAVGTGEIVPFGTGKGEGGKGKGRET